MIATASDDALDKPISKRIVMLADWLPPDFGAVGQYMLQRAHTLAERGHAVQLIGFTSGVSSTEDVEADGGSLVVTRLAMRPVPRRSLVARLVWTMGANLRLVSHAFRSLREADSILFTGSPAFLVHFLAPLRGLLRGGLVYRITDFHPECLVAALQRRSLVLSFLQALTNFWRRRIEQFEVLGEDQKHRLVEKGIPVDRIMLVRDGSPVTFAKDSQPAPLPPELTGAIVLLYSGNFGEAHDWETVAEGYRLHHRQGSGRVRIWLNATGNSAVKLQQCLSKDDLPFVCSQPVPLDDLPGLLLAPQAHLVSLKDAFVGFVMPSKIYACLESGRPVVFVGSAKSDVHLLAQDRAQAYWRTDCGDSAGFAKILEDLADLAEADKRSPSQPLQPMGVRPATKM